MESLAEKLTSLNSGADKHDWVPVAAFVTFESDDSYDAALELKQIKVCTPISACFCTKTIAMLTCGYVPLWMPSIAREPKGRDPACARAGNSDVGPSGALRT